MEKSTLFFFLFLFSLNSANLGNHFQVFAGSDTKFLASRDYISVSVSKLEFGFIQLIRIERSNFSRTFESYVSILSFIFSRRIVAIQKTSEYGRCLFTRYISR